MTFSKGEIARAPLDWRRLPPNPAVALVRHCMSAGWDEKIEMWTGTPSGGLAYEFEAANPRIMPKKRLIRLLKSLHISFVYNYSSWNKVKFMKKYDNHPILATTPFRIPGLLERYQSNYLVYHRPQGFLDNFGWEKHNPIRDITFEICARVFGYGFTDKHYRLIYGEVIEGKQIDQLDKINLEKLRDLIETNGNMSQTLIAWSRKAVTRNTAARRVVGEYRHFWGWELDMCPMPVSLCWFTYLYLCSSIYKELPFLNEEIAKEKIKGISQSIGIQNLEQQYSNLHAVLFERLKISLERPQLSDLVHIKDLDPKYANRIAVLQFLFLAPYAYNATKNAARFHKNRDLRNLINHILTLQKDSNASTIDKIYGSIGIDPEERDVMELFHTIRNMVIKQEVDRVLMPYLFHVSSWFKPIERKTSDVDISKNTRALCFANDDTSPYAFKDIMESFPDFRLAGVLAKIDSVFTFISVDERGARTSLNMQEPPGIQREETLALYLRKDDSYPAS